MIMNKEVGIYQKNQGEIGRLTYFQKGNLAPWAVITVTWSSNVHKKFIYLFIYFFLL